MSGVIIDINLGRKGSPGKILGILAFKERMKKRSESYLDIKIISRRVPSESFRCIERVRTAMRSS